MIDDCASRPLVHVQLPIEKLIRKKVHEDRGPAHTTRMLKLVPLSGTQRLIGGADRHAGFKPELATEPNVSYRLFRIVATKQLAKQLTSCPLPEPKEYRFVEDPLPNLSPEGAKNFRQCFIEDSATGEIRFTARGSALFGLQFYLAGIDIKRVRTREELRIACHRSGDVVAHCIRPLDATSEMTWAGSKWPCCWLKRTSALPPSPFGVAKKQGPSLPGPSTPCLCVLRLCGQGYLRSYASQRAGPEQA